MHSRGRVVWHNWRSFLDPAHPRANQVMRKLKNDTRSRSIPKRIRCHQREHTLPNWLKRPCLYSDYLGSRNTPRTYVTQPPQRLENRIFKIVRSSFWSRLRREDWRREPIMVQIERHHSPINRTVCSKVCTPVTCERTPNGLMQSCVQKCGTEIGHGSIIDTPETGMITTAKSETGAPSWR